MGIKKGQYSVKQLDEAIERERAMAEQCESEGSKAGPHFRENVGYLRAMREREACE